MPDIGGERLSTGLAVDDRFGVVIVNYRTTDLTLRCVASLLEHQMAAPESIVVVDNGSPDDSGVRLRAELPVGIRFYQSIRNGGFGAGVNFGMSLVDAELVLVLNPDTYFLRNQVEEIRALFRGNPSMGLMGLRLINPDGSLQYSARRFYSLIDILVRRSPIGRSPLFQSLSDSHLMCSAWNGGIFSSDWVMGTGFVVRRSVYMKLGGMDEGYFLYLEEVDLCARIWIHGWQVRAVPYIELVHDHQRHSAQGIWSTSARIHLRSMLRFFRKFGVPWLRRPRVEEMRRRYLRWRQYVRWSGGGLAETEADRALSQRLAS